MYSTSVAVTAPQYHCTATVHNDTVLLDHLLHGVCHRVLCVYFLHVRDSARLMLRSECVVFGHNFGVFLLQMTHGTTEVVVAM
jgi:hypothetical protein